MNKKYIKELSLLSLPIFISYFLEIVFGLFDKMIIGRISLEGYNSVSFMVTFLYLITGVFGVLSTCFNIKYNRNIKDKEKKNQILSFYITLSIIIGVLLEILFIIFGKAFISYIYHLSNTSLNYAYWYLVIAGITVLINLLIFIFSSLYRAHKNTKIQAKVTFVSLIVNLFLDYVLVFGIYPFPKLGVIGAAIGTTVGLLFGVVIYIINLKKYPEIKISLNYSKKELIRTYKLFFPLFLEELLETTVFILFLTSIVSNLSNNIIGIYNVIDTISGFLMLVSYGYASTALTLFLQQKDYNYPKKASLITFLITFILGLLIILNSSLVSSVIVEDVSVMNNIHKYIILGIIVCILNSIKEIYKQVLQGINYEKMVLITSTTLSTITIILLLIFNNNLNIIYVLVGLMYFIETIIFYVKFIKTKNNT